MNRYLRRILRLGQKIPMLLLLGVLGGTRRLFVPANEHGLPVPRYYWSKFLNEHRSCFRGHALEVGTNAGVLWLGGGRGDHPGGCP
jgi:hypothetical protein